MDLSSRAIPLQREVRAWSMTGLELRSGDQPDTSTLDGHASVTGHPYEVRDAFGTFTETIQPGAFRRTLGENPDVVLLTNHGGVPMASTRNGTLQLSEDDIGLHVQATLDMTRNDSGDIAKAVRRGDLSEMSFAFRIYEGGQSWNDDYSVRDITQLNLHRGDVSVVTYGANPATLVAVRALSLPDGELDLAELVSAYDAVTADGGTDDQRSLIARAVHALQNLSPEAEIPLSVLEAQRALWLLKHPA